jgi:hypothetical protein
VGGRGLVVSPDKAANGAAAAAAAGEKTSTSTPGVEGAAAGRGQPP